MGVSRASEKCELSQDLNKEPVPTGETMSGWGQVSWSRGPTQQKREEPETP